LETLLIGAGRAGDTIIYTYIHLPGGVFNVISTQRAVSSWPYVKVSLTKR